MHETILARDISTLLLQAVPPTILSLASTRLKSKIAPQFSLGPDAIFVENLRVQALARQSTTFVDPCRSMFSRDVEGAPMNNANNINKHLHPICALGRARHPREDGPRRGVRKQTKQIKKTIGPTGDTIKTRALTKFGGCKNNSNDSDVKLLGENDDTSYTKVSSDSTYCEGD